MLKSVVRRCSGWAAAILALGFSGTVVAEPQAVANALIKPAAVVETGAVVAKGAAQLAVRQPVATMKTTEKESAQPVVTVKTATRETVQPAVTAKTATRETVQPAVTAKTAAKESANPAVLAPKAAKEPSKPVHVGTTAPKAVAESAQVLPQVDTALAKPGAVVAKGAAHLAASQPVATMKTTERETVQPAVTAKTATKETAQPVITAKTAAKESAQPAATVKTAKKETAQPVITAKTAAKESAKPAVLAPKAVKDPFKPVQVGTIAPKAVAEPAQVLPQVDTALTKTGTVGAKRTTQSAAITVNQPAQRSATAQLVMQPGKSQSKQLALSQASGHQEQDEVSNPSVEKPVPTQKTVVTQAQTPQSSKNKVSPVLGSSENPIKVGLLRLPPFVIERQGSYSGLVVAYWEKIASRHGWHYQFVDAGKNYAKAVEAASLGRYDLVLGNFSTTYDRSKLVDFSRPFLLNYASILTKPETRNVFWTILKVVKMIMPVLFFLLTVLCCITLVFVFTRDLTEERGLTANAFCAVMALMRMGGYVQKPNAFLSRVVVMILAFFSVFFMATFSAVMTDALLLVEQPQDPFVVLSDLKGKTFIVAEGSSFVEVVRGYDANVVEIPDAEYAGRYYFANRSKYDGFVGDQALVHELARQLSSRDIIQSGINLRNDELVFLYNKRFPYQDEVDEGILRLQDKNVSMLICAHYLGVDSKLCVL